MSVGSIIGGGLALVRRRPGTLAAWCAIYLVFMLLGMTLMRPIVAGMAAFQQQVAANAAAGIKTPPAFPAEAFGTLFLVEFVAGILGIAAFAAIVRATAWPGPDRFAFLRFGMDELRLIGLAIILVAFAFAFELLAILAVVIGGVLFGLAGVKGAMVAVFALLAFAFVGVAIYLDVRISLAPVFTVLRRRIVIGPAWRATKGRFWTLFGAYLLLSLLFVLVSVLMLALTNPHLLLAYATLQPQALQAAAQEQMVRQAAFAPATIVQAMVGAILFVVMGAIAVGGMTTAALELCGDLAVMVSPDPSATP